MSPLPYDVDDHVGPDIHVLLDIKWTQPGLAPAYWLASAGWPPLPLIRTPDCRPRQILQSATRAHFGLKNQIACFLIRIGRSMLDADRAV